MADVIDALSFERTTEGRRYINYRDLSVQQLGSIYERLLEHEVIRDGGTVAIRPNIFARRASGSYYTHDDLVGLIIRETISPFVVQRMEVFRAANEEQASSSKPEDQRLGILKRADPAEKLLDLKICDPAMGSGHFLAYAVIHALDRLAALDCKRFSDRPARDPTSACHRVRVNRTGVRARADRARIPKIGRILLDLVLDSF